jgi:hypothetical protein
MRRIRTMPESGWVPIANAFAQNHRLSWRAKGLLQELLSYPDNWDVTVDSLVQLGRNERRNGGNAEGRDAMHAAMNELVQAGYAAHVRTRGERGQWVTTLVVSDAPLPRDRPTENPQSANQESEDPQSADQLSGDQLVKDLKTETNTENKTDEDQRTWEQHSASLASLAATADAAADDESIKERCEKVYAQIDNLTEADRRKHLLIVERRRPRIYRDARRGAIKQVKDDSPRTLTNQDAAVKVIDRLAYKYVAQHYLQQDGELPLWLARLVNGG